MHVSSTVGVQCADIRRQIYMARDMTIVHVCNITLYLAYVHGLFTMTKASNVCHHHLYM